MNPWGYLIEFSKINGWPSSKVCLLLFIIYIFLEMKLFSSLSNCYFIPLLTDRLSIFLCSIVDLFELFFTGQFLSLEPRWTSTTMLFRKVSAFEGLSYFDYSFFRRSFNDCLSFITGLFGLCSLCVVDIDLNSLLLFLFAWYLCESFSLK